jgi:centrosomal protein CEP41
MSDERKGVESGHLLAEKGFDNVFLVSGGYEKFASEYPGMIEGKHVVSKPSPSKSITKLI